MRGRALKDILISFLCTIALLTGMLSLALSGKAGLSFAASSPDAAIDGVSDKNPDEKTLIRIATWYNEYNLMYQKAFLAKEFPDYTFEYEYIDRSNYEPILDAKLSYKGAPDIIYVDREMSAKHALSGYIEVIGDLCDGFEDDARLSFMYGNSIYAVPNTSQFECFYYNKNLFRDNDIAVPDSFDSFISSCEQVRKKAQIRPLIMSLKNPYSMANVVLMTVAAEYFGSDRGRGFGGRLQYGRTTFDEELGPYMKDIRLMLKRNIICPEMYVTDFQTAVDEFTQGEAAMILGGPETYNAIMQENHDMEIGTIPFFGTADKAMIGGCDVGFALNKNAANHDEAKEVLRALASREGQAALWQDRPGSQTYLEGVSFTNDSVFDGIEGMVEDRLIYTPWMDWGKDLNKVAYYELGWQMQRVLLGRENLDMALMNVDEVVYKTLSGR